MVADKSHEIGGGDLPASAGGSIAFEQAGFKPRPQPGLADIEPEAGPALQDLG